MNESVVLPAREAIHSYVANVRFHLSDLPSEELDELVGGLEADLAERATELPDGADLSSAFGAPEAYAAELRSAAGLPPRVVEAVPAPPRPGFLREQELSWRASRDAFLATHSWAAELRPVWWVTRGAILAMPVALMTGIGLGNPVAWLMVLAGAGLSFWWSRRDPAPSTWTNRLGILASVAALLLAIPMALTVMARSAWSGGSNQAVYSEPQWSAGPVMGSEGVWVNGEPATNLYVYDADGNRIDRVRIFNQYGQAVAVPLEGLEQINVELGRTSQPALPTNPDGSRDVNRVVFPIRWGSLTGWEASTGQWEPPVKISTLPADPQASADPSATATPAPTATPEPSPSATVSP
ncbi:MAG TPA: hypothetical protein PLU83_06645 [Phycicoccus sp.]|jgi:hypothetical protein|nr:hypothetical protein [Phycicoccus sp.]HQK31362.1 hypothetical protein [Phycicoccus sp.]HQY96648.1 hypothetical protein [Phycicoccus sp.]HRA44502.1 hypothetical protein [Phycicoccus sp.]